MFEVILSICSEFYQIGTPHAILERVDDYAVQETTESSSPSSTDPSTSLILEAIRNLSTQTENLQMQHNYLKNRLKYHQSNRSSQHRLLRSISHA